MDEPAGGVVALAGGTLARSFATFLDSRTFTAALWALARSFATFLDSRTFTAALWALLQSHESFPRCFAVLTQAAQGIPSSHLTFLAWDRTSALSLPLREQT